MTVEPSNNISVFRRDTEWSSHVRINRSKGEQRKTRVIWLLLTLCLPFPHCFVNQMRFIDGDNAWMSLNTCLLFKRKLIYRNVIYLLSLHLENYEIFKFNCYNGSCHNYQLTFLINDLTLLESRKIF